jgi:hypothetical protein
MNIRRFAGFVFRILLVVSSLLNWNPAQAQEEPQCYVLTEIDHVGPLNPNMVDFTGTGDVFTALYKAEYDGVKASWPNSTWTVDTRAGTARYEQPQPPATMDLEFTPGPGTWCVGEEKRFAITTRPTGTTNGNLRFKYTPRYNYATWAQVTTVSGANPFENVIIDTDQAYTGEGNLRLLHAAFPEIKVEFLLEGGFGAIIIEYRYQHGTVAAQSPTPTSGTPGASIAGNTFIFAIMGWIIAWLIMLFLGRL